MNMDDYFASVFEDEIVEDTGDQCRDGTSMMNDSNSVESHDRRELSNVVDVSEDRNLNGRTTTGLVDVQFDEDDLVGVIVRNEKDAYEVYNDHTFKIGFSIRRSNQRCRVDKSISMKQYVCSKAGSKKNIPKEDKCYSKLDVRSDCPAFVQFHVDRNGTWVVTKHVRDHNHVLCPPESSYFLRSHRRVSKTQLTYLKELQKSGVGVADGFRVLKNQSGGSPFVGFSIRDAYNALNNSKSFNGTDSHTLISIFKNRAANEKDFFFEFELDSESRLCSLFWRDGRMREDYELFGDLVVHDTTYRTNKYDMICAPFVGMNHHGYNIMFGCGFLLNERTESFEWLFRVFLRSMGGKHPVTIMTDQSAAMSSAIATIFINSRHRLCVWHIGENSKKHIGHLRSQKGFVELFNQIMKYTETIAEFELYWQKLLSKYHCEQNAWLIKLYKIKEKWCAAFSKDFFSGGIMSSQRSESTNHSISRRLSKTACLRDFYMCFVEVVSEWRSNENGEDIRCLQGKPSMVLSDSKLLIHARDVYTLEVYDMFEKQFLKGMQYHQICFNVDGAKLKYHVWVDGIDTFRHEVNFFPNELFIECTCKMFLEVGILCSHSLRIFNINCIPAIPERYILKRWMKDVVAERTIDSEFISSSSSKNSMASSLWRIQRNRKFHELVVASEDNIEARKKLDEILKSARVSITEIVGPIHNVDHADGVSNSCGIVQNPQSTSLKNKRNKRQRGIIEKKCKQAKGKKNKTQSAERHTKMVVQQMQVAGCPNFGNNAYVVHPSSQSKYLEVVDPNWF